MGKFSILFPLWANKRLFLSPYQFLEYVSILDGRDNIEIALGHVNSYRNMKPLIFETCYRLVPYWDAREGDIIYNDGERVYGIRRVDWYECSLEDVPRILMPFTINIDTGKRVLLLSETDKTKSSKVALTKIKYSVEYLGFYGELVLYW